MCVWSQIPSHVSLCFKWKPSKKQWCETWRKHHRDIFANVKREMPVSTDRNYTNSPQKKSVPIPSPRTLSSRYPFHDGNSDGNKKSKLIFGKKSSTSPWKLTWQWKKQPFQEMLIFHCHVSFPEGNTCFQTYSSYPTWVWLIGPFWTRSQSCRDVFPA